MGQVYRIWSVDVDQYFFEHLVVHGGLVPDWVDHEDIFARRQAYLRIQKREHEPIAKTSLDEFPSSLHQDDIKIGWIKPPALLFQAIMRKSVTLLQHGNGKGLRVDINGAIQIEGKESLWHWTLILGAEAVV